MGAIAPDLPYASVGDDDLILRKQTEYADRFHYEKTDEIPLRAFSRIRGMKDDLAPADFRAYFAFFVGYMSHVAADGLIHPFVRDKVGDYRGHETEHRRLEMQLDVLYYYRLTAPKGAPGELNFSNLYEELLNAYDSPVFMDILRLFADLVEEVYEVPCDPEEISGWVGGLHRLFGIAEGRHLGFFRGITILRDFFFPDVAEIAGERDEILTLTRPVDRERNFLGKDRVHFFDDILPRFYVCFIPMVRKAYNHVYSTGPALTVKDLPLIDLDTGRLLAVKNDLSIPPALWTQRA